ncbi:DNA cytosine methyltransferase [Tenacibaculum finnmarkense genomovar ulcerans]|uniref:DNA cytosine methyltransferase n=1 Tax=Tenacibaculum finnmarkense TaxID=2781243 RepID=UPI001E5985C1|nr:DNA cytosine methyltransferase [Tenacibaculum finnmarkense]MCD8431737.1 DNA cytosine methyltransferase [Tenacibaculum finnmarkense genomovar ulcerans]
MIEYYSKYFKSNYKSKVNQLIIDIKRLLELENIELINENSIVLNENLQKNLDSKTWIEINSLYNTLLKQKDNISPTLFKFINKTENNNNSKLKCIDTFAGCGGLSLGLKNAGFNPVLINEIEPKFLESYYFNHNIHLDNYYCGDIKDIANSQEIKNKYKDIDLIVGGPPCQGFSMANRQRLLDDPRNKLYKYYLDLLGNLKPKFFIMENVKGMMKKSNEILDNFNSILGTEYSIEMTLLNAKDFGIPQNRERVFVIGSRIKNVSAKDIISDIINLKDEIKTVKLKDALFGLPKLEPKRQKNSRGIENDKIGYKFTENSLKTNKFIKEINNNKKSKYLSNHTNRFNNDRDIEIFNRLPQGANSLHESIKDIMPYSSRNHMFKDKYFKLNENEISKTITSHMKMDCNMYIHPNQSRGLSPREASRIQTFPDDFIFMGANNTWYAQIGNAVPVKLAEVIGKQIVKYLN